MKKQSLIISSVLILLLCFTRCKTDEITPTNIVLYNKPLKTMQQYIQGKWKLQYAYGGFSTHKYTAVDDSYMILSPNHITMGNSSKGVVVDTTIVWTKTDIGTNDFTYLLSYSWAGYPWPEYYVVDQIKNDTLIIREYVNDGYDYYYTKY